VVTKKGRVCMDLRDVNKESIDHDYPVPNLKETLCMARDSKYFSTLDAVKSFWQMKVREEDRDHLSFTVKGKKCRYCRVPFGQKNAMESVSSDCCWR